MSAGIVGRFHLAFPGEDGFRLAVDLALPGQGVTSLFGHSGSGKTTVLRCIAGLEHAPSGYLEVNGEVWQDSERKHFLPTYKRALGYVFQEASLFAHLSVARNLEYGMKRSGVARDSTAWQQAIALLGIEQLLQRMPDHLSGGERQRVAIARALLTRPKLLLMDEPLSALDIKRKQEILPYLERLHDELAIPVLYVSHQPDEVVRLADYLVLMERGSVLASGPLLEVLARLDLPTALAQDAGAVIEATVGMHDERYHLMRLDFGGGSILVPHRDVALGKRLRLQIHARDVSLALSEHDDSSILNRVAAIVTHIASADHPAQVLVRLDAGGTALLARITRQSCEQLNLAAGKRVWAQIKSVALLA